LSIYCQLPEVLRRPVETTGVNRTSKPAVEMTQLTHLGHSPLEIDALQKSQLPSLAGQEHSRTIPLEDTVLSHSTFRLSLLFIFCARALEAGRLSETGYVRCVALTARRSNRR